MDEDSEAAAEFDQFAERYDDMVNASLGFMPVKVEYFTRVKAGYFLDLLRRHLGATQGLDVLDIGCGTGNLHRMIAGELHSLTGVDVSQASLERARAMNPFVTYRHYDGVRLPYSDGQFDVALTICVMHHVPPAQWVGFLREIRRVVKKDGILTVFEHNPRNPLTRRTVGKSELDADAVLLDMGKAKALLAEAGLTKASLCSILSILTCGPLSRRLDEMLGRLGLGAQYFAMARV
jgi:ubiquinone/menaquinone biosynthesis C-methylase UbiE